MRPVGDSPVIEDVGLLIKLLGILNESGIKYFITGSVASMHYGESRSTRDIDVAVHLRYGDVGTLLEKFCEPEFHFDRLSAVEALQSSTSFNIIHKFTRMKIDFMCLEHEGFDESRLRRAVFTEMVGGSKGWVSAPEDVILKKLEFYKQGGSDKHLRDIASMIKFSGPTFDREYLESWAKALAVTEEWNAVKSRVGW